MISFRYSESRVQAELTKAFGQCFSARQFQDVYIAGKAALIAASRKTKELAFAESVGFYERIISNENVEAKYKIAAQTRLDTLFSLEPNRTNAGYDPEKVAEALRGIAASMQAATVVQADPDAEVE